MVSSPRLQRGTSVIAALVFAAILGTIAISLNELRSNSGNTVALSAAADTAVTTPAKQTPAQIQQACDQAIQQLISSGQTTSQSTTQAYPTTDKNQIKDNCVDAMLKSGATDKTNPASYQCIGKTTKVSVTSTGLNVNSSPNSQEPAGECRTWSCGSGDNASCSPDSSAYAGLNNGFNSSPTANPTAGPATVTPDAGLTPGEDIPANCTANADASKLTCPNSTPQQATDLSDPNGYTCSYSASNQTTTCTVPPDATTACPAGQTGTPPNCTPAAGACPAGQTGTPPNCVPSAQQQPPAQQKPPAQQAPAQQAPSQSGSGMGGLGSLLSGLAKGLTSGLSSCSGSSANNTTLVPTQVYNQNTGTYSTVYVQQPTSGTGQPCPITGTPTSQPSQSAPYGTGTDGNACPAPPAPPQCASGATAQPITSSNGCLATYQCVPTNSTITQTPTPSISCSPQLADVGQSVAISYSCTNATGSSASGFSTNNQTSGSATAAITAPPSGTNTANFGLTCTNNGQNASAQCSVQINQPAIDLVGDPQSVPSGGTASIGWVTAGMKSCVVSSPSDSNFTQQNANITNVNGVAQTDAITQKTEFDLTCTTLGGQTKTASIDIVIGSSTTPATASVNVSSSIDGASVNHGGTATITWSDAAAASSTTDAIWLIDLNTEQATALIASGQPTSGSYTWSIPAANSTCDSTTYNVCGADLVDGSSYGIEVAEYTPTNAYLGPSSSAPANAVSPTYENYGFTANPFSIGQ